MGHQVAHRTEISINLFVRDRSGGYAQLGTDCVRSISKANAFFRRCMITSTDLMPFHCQTVEASNIVNMRPPPPVSALTRLIRFALATGDLHQVLDYSTLLSVLSFNQAFPRVSGPQLTYLLSDPLRNPPPT